MAEFKYVLKSVLITSDTPIKIVIEVIRKEKCIEELEKNSENHLADNKGRRGGAVVSMLHVGKKVSEQVQTLALRVTTLITYLPTVNYM
jgi:hypothetical protein